MTAAELQRTFMEATRVRTLFEIVKEGLAVLARLDDTNGEVTPSIASDLDALADSLEHKAEAYAAIHKQLLANADASERMADDYRERAKQQRARAELLKARLFDAMQLLGRDKIETPTSTAAIQKSPPSVELLCADNEVPAEYVEVKRVVRKDEIKAALQAGQQLTFARLKRGVHLRFR